MKENSADYGAWEEWMGYTVHYIHNKDEYIDQKTSYGVTMERAINRMLNLLQDGCCAWIQKIDPHSLEDIPF